MEGVIETEHASSATRDTCASRFISIHLLPFRLFDDYPFAQIEAGRSRFPVQYQRPQCILVRHFRPNFAVLASEKQKRLALAHHHVLHFRNKNGVIAGLLR